MADIYLRSTDGNNADSGLTWALADANLSAALTAAGAGGRVFMSDNHAETTAASITHTSPGTAASPTLILCVDDAGDPEPPTALATTGTVSTTGASNISNTGHATGFGFAFQAASAASSAQLQWVSATSWSWVLDTCALFLRGSSATSRILVGSTSSTMADSRLEHINGNVQFSGAAQAINAPTTFIWRGGALIAGTVPTGGLIKCIAGVTTNALLEGVNLTVLANNAVVGIGTGSMGGAVIVRDCLLFIGAPLTTGTNPGPGQTEVIADNSSESDVVPLFRKSVYAGSLTTNIGIFLTTGAPDSGYGPVSHVMISSANATFLRPLYSREALIWNTVVGVARTLTIEMTWDSAADITDAEAWVEVGYLGTSGETTMRFVSDRKAGYLTAAAAQATSTAAWTGTGGFANPRTQKFEVTFTATMVGFVRIRVALAKASTTIYVSPPTRAALV